MKRNYQQPILNVVHLQHQNHLLDATVTNFKNNASLNYGGGNSGEGRSRGFGGWDDEE